MGTSRKSEHSTPTPSIWRRQRHKVNKYPVVFSEQGQTCQLFLNLHPLTELTMCCHHQSAFRRPIIFPLSLPDRSATLKAFVPHTTPGWGDRLDIRSCVWCRKSNNWNFHPCLNREQWGWLRREQQEFPSIPCVRFQRKCCRNIHHNSNSSGDLLAYLHLPAAAVP